MTTTYTNEITITTYDLDTYLDADYVSIAIYRAETFDSAYTEITTSGTRLELVDGTEFYFYTDETATSKQNTYKFKYFKADNVTSTDYITSYFYGDTSDLTEKLRYMIEDICGTQRYTTKELRRFINLAINRLQTTSYRKRFKSDFDGIITPQMFRVDEAVILLQAMIIVNQSQQTRAADTNMSMRDGRGSYNIRTSESLKQNLKEWKDELNKMIKDTNRLYISPTVVDMLETSPYYSQYINYGGC